VHSSEVTLDSATLEFFFLREDKPWDSSMSSYEQKPQVTT
jgi:hypothetical protein